MMFQRMEGCQRCFLVLVFSMALLCIGQQTGQNKKVTYILARSAQDCTTACTSRGMSCIEFKAFPDNALTIFHSLNVSCSTPGDTSWYHYLDHPNYCVAGDWKGRCMGFKGLKRLNSTNCGKGGNPSVRRLCPCETTSNTNPPSRPSITTASSWTARTTATSSSSSSSSATATSLVKTTKFQFIGVETKLNTWQIAVLVIALAVGFSGLFLLIVFVKKNKGKRKKSSPLRIRSVPEKIRDVMHGSDNIVYIESMVDMNNLPISSSTDNVLYESTCDPYEECQLNELYVGCAEETKKVTTTENPLYEESASDEQQECVKEHSIEYTDEYASIDEI